MKGKGLTIMALLGKGKPGASDEDESMSSPASEAPDDELPTGLVAAVREFRAAETDEEAARALKNAFDCCM